MIDQYLLVEKELCWSPFKGERYIRDLDKMPKGSWREFGVSSSDDTSKSVESNEISCEQSVRVQKTRAGKSGKTVTLITGMSLTDLDLKNLLKRLKINCGTGGTIKNGIIELQGDHTNKVLAFLIKEGYRPKKSGG